ncbi:MAG TPA: 4-hydroxythreonine-4-phosphate dehydrogenase PdxA [Planctomycetota bacterium]|nr:4-hydroxythreonine-4-phosphate dehydrogenase PdxA [Planctomycetota bacterium]
MKLAVTLGDPAGVGPEVVDKALRETWDADFTVLGSRSGGGREALAAIDQAIDLALAKKVDGIVTGPVSKERIARTGVPFIGHTEHLASRAGVKQPVMLFVAGSLRVALVTTHVSLLKLPGMITADRILGILRETSTGLRERFGIAEPRLAVCGLNPHAGEGGEFGREEIDTIAPAIDAARQEGIRAEGPFAADTIWKRSCDAIVSMYHDQGLGPIKAMHPDAVNVTLGLPFVRTSPDHGTAFDIAGKGVADPSSMKEAVRLAVELAARRGTKGWGSGLPSLVPSR